MRPINLVGSIAAVTFGLLAPAGAYARDAPVPASARLLHAQRPRATARAHNRRHVRTRDRRHTTAELTSLTSAPVTIPEPTGTTYYVSPGGADNNSGTSPATAWQTVTQVDRAALKPGDEVLFQGGASFSDDALMPGWGETASGTSDAPISFGSYGQGEARITQGVWFKSDNNLAFHDLTLGSETGYSGVGFQGDGEGITLLRNTIAHVGLGINAEGDDWSIADNVIADTGDSGMLLGYSAGAPGDPAGGSNYLVTGNTITYTGLNPALAYGTHGIYDKVVDSTITDNTISHFNDDGISVRYRNSTITNNTISYGKIGIAWFQYDSTAGASDWTGNAISNVSAAAIFICGVSEGCNQTLESFRISGTVVSADRGPELNLAPTTGTYSIGGANSHGPVLGAVPHVTRSSRKANHSHPKSGARHRATRRVRRSGPRGSRRR
jgi:Right handed beta helix region